MMNRRTLLKKPRLSHERKNNKDFVEIDSRHGSRVGSIDRLRSTVKFTQDPKPLTYKRTFSTQD